MAQVYTASHALSKSPCSCFCAIEARSLKYIQTDDAQLMLHSLAQEGMSCSAGSCRTFSTGPKHAHGLALNATSESMMARFPDTQDSNREGRKRKASRAEVAPFAPAKLPEVSVPTLLAMNFPATTAWHAGQGMLLCAGAHLPAPRGGEKRQPAAPSEDAAQDLKTYPSFASAYVSINRSSSKFVLQR